MTGFIADEHIPLPSILLLREAGYRVLSIREEYPPLMTISFLALRIDKDWLSSLTTKILEN